MSEKLVVVGICLGVGYIIKTSLNFIPNKYIPLMMGILGYILNAWICGSITPEILLGGLFSGLHQVFKQLING